MLLVCAQSGVGGGRGLTSAIATVPIGKPSVEEHSIIVAHNSESPNTCGGFGDMSNAACDRDRDEMSAFNFTRTTGAHLGVCAFQQGMIQRLGVVNAGAVGNRTT